MSRRPGPEKLGDLLRDFLETSGLGHTIKHVEVHAAWQEVVGPVIASHTRVSGLAHHKLYVDVDSASHRHELTTFYKKQLLEGLRQQLPALRIHDIVFRPASPPGA